MSMPGNADIVGSGHRRAALRSRGTSGHIPRRLGSPRWGHAHAAIAAAACALLVGSAAFAQSAYPSRQVRLIVGFGAGGVTDIVARIMGNKLGAGLGQSFVIENRTGGSGTIATEAVARAEPDGHTLLMVPFANAVNETLFKTNKYRGGEHLVAVAPVAESGNVLIVHPSVEVRSVADLIALARSRPRGDIVAASSGRGTANHLAIELFNTMTGVKLTPVHYKGGGDSIRDLVTGEVKVMFATIVPILEYLRSGALRGIATTGPVRDSALPDLPTVIESGLPDFDVRVWLGIMAPAGTPGAVIARLSAETMRALKEPDTKALFAAQGFDPMPGTTEMFAALYLAEVAKWRKVIEATGITNE